MPKMRDLIEAQERADVLRKMARREQEQRRAHRRFMWAIAVLALAIAAAMVVVMKVTNG